MFAPSRHLCTFFIAGFQRYDGALVLSDLKPGAVLSIQPQPENPYDPNALALVFDSTMLGYVPKASNELPALLMFYGHSIIEARVLQVNPEADPWEQVRVGLYFTDARPLAKHKEPGSLPLGQAAL